SAQAAKDAKDAQAAANRADGYAMAAGEDALKASSAAMDAQADANAADAAATEAEKDAANARAVATKAEEDAASARATATKAEEDATAAETAAAGARDAAEEAQDAADRTERSGNSEQISQGVTSGIGDVWAVLDHIEYIGEPKDVVKDNCNPFIHFGDCKITATVTYRAHSDVFLCAAKWENYATTTGSCPKKDTVYLGPDVSKEPVTERLTTTLTMAQFNSGIDPVDVLLGDFIGCAKLITPGLSGGSWGDCAWAASWFVAGPIFRAGKAAVAALDASLKLGVGFMDAYRALRTVGLTEAAIQGILGRIFRMAGEACTVADAGTLKAASFKLASFNVTSLAASSPNDELIEKCRRILKDIVKDGDRVVLGINPHSDDLTKLPGGPGGFTFNNGDYGTKLPREMGLGERPIWTIGVEEAVANPNVRISVTLDGVPGAANADEALNALLKRGEGLNPTDWDTIAARGNGTAWEMTKLRAAVRRDVRGWKTIDWWMTNSEGKVVRVYPEKWKYANGDPVAD
ncbi:polymorphic toxin type 27 domain-containing protein, partial [Streptomyces venezuelae]|uniref:polymorphic toxin type 27 domain-containing protein n=1 Tax=Streptomyces venezuelae TaxID=54571 RepID=UPI00278C1C5D